MSMQDELNYERMLDNLNDRVAKLEGGLLKTMRYLYEIAEQLNKQAKALERLMQRDIDECRELVAKLEAYKLFDEGAIDRQAVLNEFKIPPRPDDKLPPGDGAPVG